MGNRSRFPRPLIDMLSGSVTKAFFIRFLLPFLTSRLLILFILLIAPQLTIDRVPAREGQNLNLSGSFSPALVPTHLKRIFTSADGFYYQEIATNGYPAEDSQSHTPKTWVFFPLYPLTMHFVSYFTGSVLLAGLLISNVSMLLGLWLLDRYGEVLGYSEKPRNRAIWLLCFFPTSFFFSACITEGLFFALTTAAFLQATRGRVITGGLLMGLCTATRPTGTLLLPAFALLCIAQPIPWPRRILGIALAPSGVVVFAAYLYHITGDALAFSHNQLAWGRKQLDASWLADLLNDPFILAAPWNFVLLHVALLFWATFVLLHLLKRQRKIESFMILVPLVFALSTGTLQSLGRFLLVMGPMHLEGGRILDGEHRERVALVISAAVLAILALLYALHVTIAMA